MISAMNIGALAKEANVNIQTVRYYERIGILKAQARRDSGYRVYDGESLKRLVFIKRAQELGFSLDEIRELLLLRVSKAAARDRVRKKAQEKILEVRSKIKYLKKIEMTLRSLIGDCESGAASSPCPILEKMEFET